MSSVNERINQIFDETGKSKTEIAQILNVTPAYISKIGKKDYAVPSGRIIADICRAFNVSEEWIYTGSGPIHPVKTRAQEIADMANTLLADSPDSVRSQIITNLMRLDVEDWEAIGRILQKLLDK